MRLLALTILLTLSLATPALAGGWAVTTLDSVPDITAGQTYQVGWTIRQHGVSPVNIESFGPGEKTAITATSADKKETLTFTGRREGATGHYVATVSFPAQGTWTWSVSQGPFAPQPLGTVVVAAGGAASAAQKVAAVTQTAAANPAAAPNIVPAASRPAGPNGWLILTLLLASAGAAVFFGSRLAVLGVRPQSA